MKKLKKKQEKSDDEKVNSVEKTNKNDSKKSGDK